MPSYNEKRRSEFYKNIPEHMRVLLALDGHTSYSQHCVETCLNPIKYIAVSHEAKTSYTTICSDQEHVRQHLEAVLMRFEWVIYAEL